jgi:hypothetical protein
MVDRIFDWPPPPKRLCNEYHKIDLELQQHRNELLTREEESLCSDLIAFLAIGIPYGKRIGILTPRDKFDLEIDQNEMLYMKIKVDKLVLVDDKRMNLS